MYEIGVGKAEITPRSLDIGMMGYAMPLNTVESVETPIQARAFVIKDPKSNKKLVWVNAEICFITHFLKEGILKRLQELKPEGNYSDESLMLTAQHTHSAPGGYSHFGLYNISIPGFIPEVYQSYRDGIVTAILEAETNMRPARIRLTKGEFSEQEEVAFNRSVNAYNANPETNNYSYEERHLAVNREMLLLRFEDENGEAFASINWFGVHTTSLSNDNHAVTPDNKGYAALELEADMKHPNFIGAFAQAAAGDITPNFIWDPEKKWTRGKFKDDFESARYNGTLQYRKARQLLQSAREGEILEGKLEATLRYVNFSDIEVNPEFVNGQTGLKTAKPALGVAFLKGTVEGPGMPNALGFFGNLHADMVKLWELRIKSSFMPKEAKQEIIEKYRAHGKKRIAIEAADQKILGFKNLRYLPVPAFADPTIRNLKAFYKRGALSNGPWMQQRLPLQIFRIGSLVIAGFPNEITTVAGKRLEQSLLETLKPIGIEHVVVGAYTNGYAGYVTTPEEYQTQHYEGGHTAFGRWMLPALQGKFQEIALQFEIPPTRRTTDFEGDPFRFNEQHFELWKKLEF